MRSNAPDPDHHYLGAEMDTAILTKSEVIAKQHQHETPTGERLIRAGSACASHPHIKPDDLLLVNFDQHRPDTDAFYIVQAVNDSGTERFPVCRRIEFSVIRGALIDSNGGGDMRPLHEC